MTKLTIVMGLPGIGKSNFIQEAPFSGTWSHRDYRDCYLASRDKYGDKMGQHEHTVMARALMLGSVRSDMAEKVEHIVVEWPGVLRTSQSFIQTLCHLATNHDYDVRLIYLEPIEVRVFRSGLRVSSDRYAQDACNAFYDSGHARYRSPANCPYFDEVEVIGVPSRR